MKVETALEVLRKASLFEIFIISFFLLPFITVEWIGILKELEWSLKWGIWTLLAAYVAGIILMFMGSQRTKQRETVRDQILAYLNEKGFTSVSYNRIREKYGTQLTDEYLDSLPTYFPNDLRRAKLKGDKQGIARLVEEDPGS